jgi:hypothetical protein
MTRLRAAILASLAILALLASGCGGGDDSKAPAKPGVSAGVRAASTSALASGKVGDYSPSGKIVADTGFRPKTDGFSFQNYGGPGYQELGPAQMEELFGPKVCAARQGAECVLTAPAQAWMNQANKDAGNGHCYGFSHTALRMFDKQLSPLDYGGPTVPALALPGNLPLQARLAQAWAVQMTPQVLLADVGGTPNFVLDRLTDAIKTGSDRETLAIFKRDGSGGHAITPYAVEDKGGGQFAVLVYDNNYPGVTRAVQFDRNKNTWNYEASSNPEVQSSLYDGDAQTQNTFISPTKPGIGIQPCPFCPAPTPAPAALQYDQITLSADSIDHAHVQLSDAQGRRTGYVNGKLVKEIPGVRVIPVLTNENWRLKPEPRFLVPRGLGLSIAVDGARLKKPDTETLSVIGPGYSAVVSGIEVRPRERHAVSVRGSGTKVVYRAPAAKAKSPAIELGFDRAGKAHSFSVATHKLAAGATLTASVNAATDKLLLGGKNVIGGRAVVNLTSIKKSGVRSTRQQSLKLSGRQVLRLR